MRCSFINKHNACIQLNLELSYSLLIISTVEVEIAVQDDMLSYLAAAVLLLWSDCRWEVESRDLQSSSAFRFINLTSVYSWAIASGVILNIIKHNM